MAEESKRLSAERLAWIRAELSANKIISHTSASELLTELDAVTRERDEALARCPICGFINGCNCSPGLSGMNFITNRERGSK